MEAIAKRHDGLVLRIVDIGDWESPVAQQYAIRRLPTVWLYEDGRRIATDLAGAAERLQKLR